jgi:hypothetical protein
MALSWSDRRRVLYIAVFGVLAVLAAAFVYDTFFVVTPTCFDGVQNGDEHGVDCGGSCSLVCKEEAHAPVVLWSRLFETGPNTYTAAAYIQNNNPSAGSKSVPYSFQIFDADNQLIIERDGSVDLPPVQTIPVIETNIKITNRTPDKIFFSFSQPPVWNTVPSTTVPKLILDHQELSADASRLSATLNNFSFFNASKVVVAAVLFDDSGTARAASRSIVNVPQKSSVPVVFTFPAAVPNIVRAEITILPPF